MVRAVVADVTDIVVISVFLKWVVFVRTVILVVRFSILVAVKNDRLADVTFFSFRIFVKLIGVGVIRAVVASVTYVVAVAVFLKRIVFVRAVILVIEFSILVAVKNDRLADVTFFSFRIFVKLIGIGVIGAVVADVTDMVAVAVLLIRVVFIRAVILVVGLSVLVAVESGGFTRITFRSRRIVVKLVGIRMIRTVVAGVTDVVAVSIFLTGVVFVRAVILVVGLSVLVTVESGGFACVTFRSRRIVV